VPAYGFSGLAGVMIALGAGALLGFDREGLRNGSLLFNSLLAALALAHIAHVRAMPISLALTLNPIVSIGALFVTVAFNRWMQRQFGVPAMSLPFVCLHLLLISLTSHWQVQAPAISIFPVVTESWLAVLPVVVADYINCYWESFSAILFLPQPTVGLVLSLGLLLNSRLSFLFATVAFAAGMATLAIIPYWYGPIPASGASYLTFNFIFVGIALGGVFHTPSRGSLLLTIFGGVSCALVAVACLILFGGPLATPLALVFNLVTLVMVIALQGRSEMKFVRPALLVAASPEEQLRRSFQFDERFPERFFPSLICPFAGQRVVTQGVDGDITHRGAWRYALDFEVRSDDADISSGEPDLCNGEVVSDYYTFNTPVLSPGVGTVAHVVDHIADGDIGATNLQDNWGNLVIVQLDEGGSFKLCHLKQGSIRVAVGERVHLGQLIGYCGNSGRSPIPHLHMQLQSHAAVGAETIPFRLRHFIEVNGDNRTYHTAGLPIKNMRIENAQFDINTARCFTDIPRESASFDVRFSRGQSKRNWSETIHCQLSELGDYQFESRGAKLTGRVLDSAFYVLDYRSGKSAVLDWLWLGLCRVPFLNDRTAKWNDELPAEAFLAPWVLPFYDLSAAFLPWPRMQVCSQIEQEGEFAVVKTTVKTKLPRWLCRRHLPTELTVRLGHNGLAAIELKTNSGNGEVTRVDSGEPSMSNAEARIG